jgi:hypothetical protein
MQAILLRLLNESVLTRPRPRSSAPWLIVSLLNFILMIPSRPKPHPFMKSYPMWAGVIISLLSASLLQAADQYFAPSSANSLTAGNAIWDAGTTHAWAANAAPGITPPGG